MPHRSFVKFAPPPVPLAEGLAVPIDIERIDARLRFNALLGDSYDATMHFEAGGEDGFPVFDLRQPIRSAWLDEMPISSGRLAPSDLGGGAHAEMRVVRQAVAARTPHKLRVAGSLGVPNVQPFNRPPTLIWNGPRLTFRFGFTDRIPGRYLESWIPANLIFDEFDLSAAIDLQQTRIPHVVISNGRVQQTGFNAWRVDFVGVSSCSPMLEIHAVDRVERRIRTIELPQSSGTIQLQVWKETSDEINSLDRALNILESCLKDYSDRLGPYRHGNQFVCILDALGNGMEYAGAATADVDQIPHEVIHSWWGRGVRPASQADGWIDEAIATWIERDSGRSFRIDSRAVARKILASPNLWTRVTPGDAYRQGRDVIRHLSALVGVERLEGLLRKLHREQSDEPLTTAKFEEFLLTNVPQSAVAVTLHRHVHGLSSPLSPPNLEFAGGATEVAWDNSSLWTRRGPDGGSENQPLQRGVNWIYVRSRNRGAFPVPFAAILIRIHSETCFDPNGIEASDFCAGASTQANWEAGEERLVAIPVTLADQPSQSAAISAQFLAEGALPVDNAAPYEGLAWKATATLMAASGSDSQFSFCVSNRCETHQRPLRLELRRGEGAAMVEVGVTSPNGLPLANVLETPQTEFFFPRGDSAAVLLDLQANSFRRIDLIIRIPADAVVGSQWTFDLIALRPEDDQLVGGIRLRLDIE